MPEQPTYGVITEQADYAGFNPLSEQDQETYKQEEQKLDDQNKK